MADDPDTNEAGWTVWVFAGPNALHGIDDHGEAPGADEGDTSIAGWLGRLLDARALADDLEILVEQIAEPNDLELLTDEWRGTRTIYAGGRIAAAPADQQPRGRSLADFLAWARSRERAAGSPRALVLLGDVLWANSDEHVERPLCSRRSSAGTRELEIKPRKEAGTRAKAERRELLPGAWDEGQPKPRFLDTSAPEPASRVIRRAAEIVLELERGLSSPGEIVDRRTLGERLDPLRSSASAPTRLELLVTDSSDPTSVGQLELLARYFDYVVAGQIELPIFGRPLADMLAALREQPRAEARELAVDIVERQLHDEPRLEQLRDCARSTPGTGETPPSAVHAAARIVEAGHDAVALDTGPVGALARRVADLAETFAGLLEDSDEATRAEVRACLDRATARYDHCLQRCDLDQLLHELSDPDSGVPPAWQQVLAPHVETIRHGLVHHPYASPPVVIASTHSPGLASYCGPLCGLSIWLPLRPDEVRPAVPLALQLDHAGPWIRAAELLREADPEGQSRAATERRVQQDMAAFVQCERDPSGDRDRAEGPRAELRAWTMLHYLPCSDRDDDAAALLPSFELASFAETRATAVHVEVLLDRSRQATDRSPPRERVHAGVEWIDHGELDHPAADIDRAARRFDGCRARVGDLELSYDPGSRTLAVEPVAARRMIEGELVSVGVRRAGERERVVGVTRDGCVHEWALDRARARLDAVGSARRLAASITAEPGWIVDDASICVLDDGGALAIDYRLRRPIGGYELRSRENPSVDGYGAVRDQFERLGPIDSGSVESFSGFIERALARSPSRHAGLVIGGLVNHGDPFSLCHDSFEHTSLTITQIADGLRRALARAARGPLELLILADPISMSLELAYELRDVARVLITPTAGSGLDLVSLVDTLERGLVPDDWGIEARALASLDVPADEPFVETLARWRHAVARHAGAELIAGAPERHASERFEPAHAYNLRRYGQRDSEAIRALQRSIGAPADGVIARATTQAVFVWQGRHGLIQDGKFGPACEARRDEPGSSRARLQALDLDQVERLGRRVDALYRILRGELGHPRLWAAFAAVEQLRTSAWEQAWGEEHSPDIPRPLDEVLAAFAQGFADASGPPPSATTLSTVERIWALMRAEAGDLWLGDTRDRRQAKLNVFLVSRRPSPGYLSLVFHQEVQFLGLLTTFRLVDDVYAEPFRLWELVLVGLTRTPSTERDAMLERITGRPCDPELSRVQFASLADPPLISLGLETDDAATHHYEIRLSSSESSALLHRQTRRVNPESIERSLEGLDFLLSGRVATAQTWAYLEALGATLGEDIINQLHDRLELERRQLDALGRGDDVHLALAIPRKLMRYPWELMLVPTDADLERKQMLIERFAVGRQVWSRGGRRSPATRDRKIRVLVVADPLTDLAPRLPGARREAELIREILVEIAGELGHEMDFDPGRDVSIGRPVTRAAMRQLLRSGNYDIVHFAGHAAFSPSDPDSGAWLLSDGLLSASELRSTFAWCPAPPWLIFANACNAAMTSDREAGHYQGEVFGLAEACIREGVGSYIAPLWQIADRSAATLATELYRSLLLGRASIGASLRRARLRTRKQCESTQVRGSAVDISWASVVLYGNPTDRLDDVRL